MSTSMAQATVLWDCSITDSAPNPRSTPIDPVIRKLLQYLSLGLTPDEILTASEKLCHSPREDLARLAGDCHRYSISLSSSQRSSLISTFSRLSSVSASPTHAQDSVPADRPHVHHETSPASCAVPQAQQRAPSPFAATKAVLICFACNKQCSTQGALKRHQDEKCERKFDWICPVCQWTGERLIRHYATSHGAQCSRCYGIAGEKVCDNCRLRLSQSYRTLPRKQSWGCPYCSAYFCDFDYWNKHCTSHHHRGETWSWPMMIWSLLQQFDLSKFGEYDWNGCDWSRLDERTGPELRDDLQRLRFPKHVRRHREYSELQIDEILVRSTHNLVAAGPPLSKCDVPDLRHPARASHQSLPRTQGATSITYPDMGFPVQHFSVNRHPSAPPDIGDDSHTQTLPCALLSNTHHHQKSRLDSTIIPHIDRLHSVGSAHTPQNKPEALLSHPIPIVTPVNRHGFRDMPNGQSMLSSSSEEKYPDLGSNADGREMLSHRTLHAQLVNLESTSGSPVSVSPEHCTAPETIRTAADRPDAEYETENAHTIPPQTSRMPDFIFQQYCSYPISSSTSDLIFQQYCSYPISSPEPEV